MHLGEDVESTLWLRSTHRPDKELVGSVGGVVEQATPLRKSRSYEVAEENEATEEQEGFWPFPHWISDVDSQDCEEAKAMLVGVLLGPCSPRRELLEGDKLISSFRQHLSIGRC
ncbi:uncharacterized protein A4U43_C02F19840 [Asparagus officinalis]|uniref:Uncharacterized protein n=1 Tax=Asparagus officinalis TaxID=4686 RepID=A0A5P1FKE2_ASPOF|nr:uncharacterized protein A4U43_C02F19840 [Asparagus officinalis]